MVYRLKVNVTSGALWKGQKVERVMEVPGTCTLKDLCLGILDAIDFDFDHLFEFTIRGRTYEGEPYEDGETSNGRNARTRLSSLKLKKGEIFELWYDFGDDWMFSIEVEEARRETGSGIRVLSAVGNVEQYPDFDDEWDDEDGGDLYDEDSPVLGFDEDDMTTLEDDFDYTAPDDLFETAFRYKKTKFWKKISGDEPFWIRFTDGSEGLVSVMGQVGEHCAAAVYMAGDPLYTYYAVSTQEPNPVWYLERERVLSQDCVQMVFDNQEYLFDAEIDAARSYAQRHGIRFSGKNAFPHFVRFSPSKNPWHPETETEEQHLKEAAEACIAISEIIGKKKPREFGFQRMTPFLREIPLVVCEGGKWKFSGMKTLPRFKEPETPQPMPDAKKMAKVKKYRTDGTLETRLVMVPATIRGENGQAPYYPYLLMALHREKEILLFPETVKSLDEEAGRIVDILLDQLIEAKWKPARILAEDKRTFTLLTPLAEGIGAKLTKVPALDMLDEFLDDFMRSTARRTGEWAGDMDDYDPEYDEDFDDEAEESESAFEDILALFHTLVDMPDYVIKSMPREMKNQLRDLLDQGIVPPELAAKVRKKLKLK